MTAYEDAIESHAAWKSLADTTQALDGDDSEEVVRLAAIIRHVERRLANSDRLLVRQATLNNIQSQADALRTQIDQYRANGNAAHLTNAQNNGESLLEQAAQLPAFDNRDGLGDVRSEITSFRRSAGQLTAALKDEVGKISGQATKVRGRLAETSKAVEAERARIDAALTEFQQQFSTSQESRANEFDASRTARQTEWSDLLASSKQELDGQREETEKQHEAALGEANARLNTQVDQAKSIVAAIDDLRDKAATVVGVVGNIGLTGDYQRNANAEKRSAIIWSFATVVFFLAAVAFAIIFVAGDDSDLSATSTARKIATSIVALAPATYCGSRAKDHRDAEQKYRALELQLASLSPFVAPLPADLQQAMKAELASRYFTGEDKDSPALDTESWLQRIRAGRSSAQDE